MGAVQVNIVNATTCRWRMQASFAVAPADDCTLSPLFEHPHLRTSARPNVVTVTIHGIAVDSMKHFVVLDEPYA